MTCRFAIVFCIAVTIAGGVRADGEDKPAAVDPADGGMVKHWERLVEVPADEKAIAAVKADPQRAIRVLMELTEGPAARGSTAEVVAKLIEQLGDPDFAKREAASAELRGMMPGVRPLLEPHREHTDAEVAWRVRQILDGGDGDHPADPQIRTRWERLLEVGDQVLQRELPIEALRTYAAEHWQSLANSSPLSQNWKRRPMLVLLASLRQSEKAEDRELLVRFAEVKGLSEERLEVALHVMQHGLTGRSTLDLPEHWRDPPAHNYGPAALKFLDVDKPGVFQIAMRLAEADPGTHRQLRTVLEAAAAEAKDVQLQLRIMATLARLGG